MYNSKNHKTNNDLTIYTIATATDVEMNAWAWVVNTHTGIHFVYSVHINHCVTILSLYFFAFIPTYSSSPFLLV